jgi:hypothetical protein
MRRGFQFWEIKMENQDCGKEFIPKPANFRPFGLSSFCFKLGFTDLLLARNLKPLNWTTQYFLGN